MSVTVLIAVFDGGLYLREAVESVLAQTYEDFELLLVDDASTDGAVERLRSDSRIRVLRNDENVGQVPSLNRGLAEARGTYVARLDADDVMLPTRLERQTEALDADAGIALVGTWLDVVDERGKRWATLRGSIDSYADFVAAIIADRLPFGHPSLMYRRDVVLELGGYDASLAPSEDKDLYRRLALGRYDARVVPEPLVRYRRHDAQLSQVQVARQLANDHRGQERFLEQLAPRLPARALRLLLAGDSSFWSQPQVPDLEAFLDAATERLRLDLLEREVVARTVAARCTRTMLTSGRSAAGLVAFSTAHGDAKTRAALALFPLARTARPLGIGLGAARRRTRRGLRSERLAPLRVRARRSRLLRRLYVRIAGFRLLDD